MKTINIFLTATRNILVLLVGFVLPVSIILILFGNPKFVLSYIWCFVACAISYAAISVYEDYFTKD